MPKKGDQQREKTQYQRENTSPTENCETAEERDTDEHRVKREDQKNPNTNAIT